MKNSSNIIIFLVLFLGMILFGFLNTKYQAQKEYRNPIDFEIYRIDLSGTKRYTFYDEKGNSLNLWNFDTYYTVFDYKRGDVLRKKANSYTLHIYRKNENGNYEIVFTLEKDPASLF